MFRVARRVRDGRMLMLGRRREPAGPTRIGLAVAVRHGNAVRRNRIKRLCREAFRLSRGDLPDGWDLVVVPRVGEEFDLPGLRASLVALARRLDNSTGRGSRDAGKGGRK